MRLDWIADSRAGMGMAAGTNHNRRRTKTSRCCSRLSVEAHSSAGIYLNGTATERRGYNRWPLAERTAVPI